MFNFCLILYLDNLQVHLILLPHFVSLFSLLKHKSISVVRLLTRANISIMGVVPLGCSFRFLKAYRTLQSSAFFLMLLDVRGVVSLSI